MDLNVAREITLRGNLEIESIGIIDFDNDDEEEEEEEKTNDLNESLYE